MNITLNVHIDHVSLSPPHPDRIAVALERLVMDMQTLTKMINDMGVLVGAVGDEMTKALTEIQADITNLQSTIAAGAQTTPEVDAALTALQGKVLGLKTTAQSLDDLVPDPVVAEPAPSDPVDPVDPVDPTPAAPVTGDDAPVYTAAPVTTTDPTVVPTDPPAAPGESVI